MRIRTATAAAGLLLTLGAAPVAAFTVLLPSVDTTAPTGLPGVVEVQPSVTPEPPGPSTTPPGWGDFGGPGNPYGPDASPMGVHWGGGAFSDQMPASSD